MRRFISILAPFVIFSFFGMGIGQLALAQDRPDLIWLRGNLGDQASAVAYSPDGKLVVTAENQADGAVKVWRVSDRMLIRTIRASNPVSVAVSSDSRLIAAATFNGPLLLWDIASGKRL